MEAIVIRGVRPPAGSAGAMVCRLMAGLLACLMVTQPLHAASASLVVGGLGGDAEYAERFKQASEALHDALVTVAPAAESARLLNGDAATREAILEAIADIGTRPADDFVLVLIGHGSADASTWRFNIPGPDITTEDLVAALAGVSAPRQVVIAAASASGALLNVLPEAQRVVVTATKSAGEINAVRFPVYLADALRDGSADIDRNEILTLAELYRYATARTAEYYAEQKLLASEHSRLMGEFADQVAIGRLGALRQAGSDPEVATLLERRRELEQAFYAVRARRGSLDSADYFAELKTVLLDIARLQRDIDRVTGWSDDGT